MGMGGCEAVSVTSVEDCATALRAVKLAAGNKYTRSASINLTAAVETEESLSRGVTAFSITLNSQGLSIGKAAPAAKDAVRVDTHTQNLNPLNSQFSSRNNSRVRVRL